MGRQGWRMVAVCAIAFGNSLAVGCSEDKATAPTSYSVEYHLALMGTLTVDSLKYDDGHGSMVKVVAPASGWMVDLAVPSGGSVEAIAWGIGAPASSATRKVTWTSPALVSQADSTTVVTVAAADFVFDIPHRGL